MGETHKQAKQSTVMSSFPTPWRALQVLLQLTRHIIMVHAARCRGNVLASWLSLSSHVATADLCCSRGI